MLDGTGGAVEWSDEPRNRAAVVVTGPAESAVTAGAERLARRFWDRRREFGFVAPTGTLDECLDDALASGARPYFINTGDTGDNPTAGGAGDVTWTLERVLARGELREPDGPAEPVLIARIIPPPYEPLGPETGAATTRS